MEDTLFRIPREWLEQSEYFATLHLPFTGAGIYEIDVESDEDRSAQASIDDDHQLERPITLDGSITSAAFEAFLSMLSP